MIWFDIFHFSHKYLSASPSLFIFLFWSWMEMLLSAPSAHVGAYECIWEPPHALMNKLKWNFKLQIALTSFCLWSDNQGDYTCVSLKHDWEWIPKIDFKAPVTCADTLKSFYHCEIFFVDVNVLLIFVRTWYSIQLLWKEIFGAFPAKDSSFCSVILSSSRFKSLYKPIKVILHI